MFELGLNVAVNIVAVSCSDSYSVLPLDEEAELQQPVDDAEAWNPTEGDDNPLVKPLLSGIISN